MLPTVKVDEELGEAIVLTLPDPEVENREDDGVRELLLCGLDCAMFDDDEVDEFDAVCEISVEVDGPRLGLL